MSRTMRCPHCGIEIPPDAPQGLCPKCVLVHNLAALGDVKVAHDTERSILEVQLDPKTLDQALPEVEILDPLGQGGMGVVYKARQRSLDRFVAVKVLRPEVADDPDFEDRFANEARTLAKLNHPNIVGVHDFGMADGLYYFIMEYVEGTTLRHMLRTEKLKAAEALAIVSQLCSALQYAHDKGVLHRDIKPENILLDKKGRVKIADFGIAKLLDATPDNFTLTRTQHALGTPHYMAPEQLQNQKEVDHRADIYSLGVVFYEMLTGEPPMGRFEPPSEVVRTDPRLDRLVLRALEREPERRYQTIHEVETAMQTITCEMSSVARFDCPCCGKGLKANVQHVGRKAKCGRCGQLVQIPGLDQSKHVQAQSVQEPLIHSARQSGASGSDVPPVAESPPAPPIVEIQSTRTSDLLQRHQERRRFGWAGLVGAVAASVLVVIACVAYFDGWGDSNSTDLADLAKLSKDQTKQDKPDENTETGPDAVLTEPDKGSENTITADEGSLVSGISVKHLMRRGGPLVIGDFRLKVAPTITTLDPAAGQVQPAAGHKFVVLELEFTANRAGAKFTLSRTGVIFDTNDLVLISPTGIRTEVRALFGTNIFYDGKIRFVEFDEGFGSMTVEKRKADAPTTYELVFMIPQGANLTDYRLVYAKKPAEL